MDKHCVLLAQIEVNLCIVCEGRFIKDVDA